MEGLKEVTRFLNWQNSCGKKKLITLFFFKDALSQFVLAAKQKQILILNREGGYRALFRFDLLACYHQNLGIFWGAWLFQKKNLSKKRPYAVQITF